MRPLTKGICPQELAINAAAWTAEIQIALAAGIKPTTAQKTRYNRPEIKSAIRAETHGKCAYCESKISHVDHGDIEHIVPKSKVPARAFDWANLTLACRICNQNKGDFHDDENDHSGLVDPYNDLPNNHFLFHRELITPRPDSAKGLLTDEELKLSRGPLLERRKERMDFIDGLMRGYFDAPAQTKPLLLNNIYQRCCSDDSEYSAAAKAYIDGVFETIGI
jgi:uncharacterized protein (TIGR02646 family)